MDDDKPEPLLDVGTRQERVARFARSGRTHIFFSDYMNPSGNGTSCDGSVRRVGGPPAS